MKTFEELVAEAVAKKLATAVEEEANRRVIAMKIRLPPPIPVPLPPPIPVPLPPPIPVPSAVKKRIVKNYVPRKCPAGSWLALSPDAEKIIKQLDAFKYAANGNESQRAKAFRAAKDLLTAGPAPRSHLTKALTEAKIVRSEGSITCIISWMVASKKLIVVPAPSA